MDDGVESNGRLSPVPLLSTPSVKLLRFHFISPSVEPLQKHRLKSHPPEIVALAGIEGEGGGDAYGQLVFRQQPRRDALVAISNWLDAYLDGAVDMVFSCWWFSFCRKRAARGLRGRTGTQQVAGKSPAGRPGVQLGAG